ncbi:MAG: hypothetical protein WC755_01470 [Candidatus Woesearchaeota archaeon]|jgi:small subunit ribosomal protein S24e
MELEIIKQKDVPVLSRKRIVCLATFDKETPTRKQVNDKLAAMVSTTPDLIITRHIYTKFGERKAKVISHVYKSFDELKKNEDKDVIIKNTTGKVKGAKKSADKKEKK